MALGSMAVTILKSEMRKSVDEQPTVSEFIQKCQDKIDKSNGALTWKDMAIEQFTKFGTLVKATNDVIQKI
jgi:hypothetical protein